MKENHDLVRCWNLSPSIHSLLFDISGCKINTITKAEWERLHRTFPECIPAPGSSGGENVS